jgi:hypothetical protein
MVQLAATRHIKVKPAIDVSQRRRDDERRALG